jgi:hypothetical protein
MSQGRESRRVSLKLLLQESAHPQLTLILKSRGNIKHRVDLLLEQASTIFRGRLQFDSTAGWGDATIGGPAPSQV